MVDIADGKGLYRSKIHRFKLQKNRCRESILSQNLIRYYL